MKDSDPKDVKTLLCSFYGEESAKEVMHHPAFRIEQEALTQEMNSLGACSRMSELLSTCITIAENLGEYKQATGHDSQYLRKQLEELSKVHSELCVREGEIVLGRIHEMKSTPKGAYKHVR